MKLPVYSRVDLSRTVALVVALCLAAASTSAVAREFRAADTQSEDYPTVPALQYMGRLIAESSSGRLQIRVFHSRQLGEEKETIEQTRAGAIDLNRTNVALIGTFVLAMKEHSRQKAKAAGVTIVTEIDRKRFEDAMAAQADPAAAALIERIRKVE
jgi:TRAP-type C4-dicarboxylate transport system substrate-binding protein